MVETHDFLDLFRKTKFLTANASFHKVDKVIREYFCEVSLMIIGRHLIYFLFQSLFFCLDRKKNTYKSMGKYSGFPDLSFLYLNNV